MTREQRRRILRRRRIALLTALLCLSAAVVALAFGLSRLIAAIGSAGPSPTTTTTSAPTTTTTADPWDLAKRERNYVAANAARYLALANAEPALSVADVILKVNIGLDRPFYTDTAPIRNPENLLVLCNKYYYLAENFSPSDLVDVAARQTRGGARLRREADEAFDRLYRDAMADGVEIRITTAFRGYSCQKALYQSYVASDGVEAADTYSARPGYSEHQTGLAMDLGGKSPAGKWDLAYFEDSPGFDWMQRHAAADGFILRFPKDKEAVTGYQYEAWHYRYVGVEAAAIIWDEGLCLEEYWAKYLTDKEN